MSSNNIMRSLPETIKLRFTALNDYSRSQVLMTGGKGTLDLTLKSNKTWDSVLQYLEKKWSKISNIRNRVQLHFIDVYGNTSVNMGVVCASLPVGDSLSWHPSLVAYLSSTDYPIMEIVTLPIYYGINEDIIQPQPPPSYPIYDPNFYNQYISPATSQNNYNATPMAPVMQQSTAAAQDHHQLIASESPIPMASYDSYQVTYEHSDYHIQQEQSENMSIPQQRSVNQTPVCHEDYQQPLLPEYRDPGIVQADNNIHEQQQVYHGMEHLVNDTTLNVGEFSILGLVETTKMGSLFYVIGDSDHLMNDCNVCGQDEGKEKTQSIPSIAEAVNKVESQPTLPTTDTELPDIPPLPLPLAINVNDSKNSRAEKSSTSTASTIVNGSGALKPLARLFECIEQVRHCPSPLASTGTCNTPEPQSGHTTNATNSEAEESTKKPRLSVPSDGGVEIFATNLATNLDMLLGTAEGKSINLIESIKQKKAQQKKLKKQKKRAMMTAKTQLDTIPTKVVSSIAPAILERSYPNKRRITPTHLGPLSAREKFSSFFQAFH